MTPEVANVCKPASKQCSIGNVIPARSWRTTPTMPFPLRLRKMPRAGRNANAKSGLRKVRIIQGGLSICQCHFWASTDGKVFFWWSVVANSAKWHGVLGHSAHDQDFKKIA